MGIKGLSKLLADEAPNSVKEVSVQSLFGRKVAIDASMVIYQFLISIRQGSEQLTNENGDVTSHITGMFYRTIKLLEAGLKPIYVFDGKPPDFKSGELLKRREAAAFAREELAKAEESGDQEMIEKFSKRTVRADKSHTEDCIKLLELMGVPVVKAVSEAEATCAAMNKAGLVYGVGTEDMDALTFGSKKMLRHMHKSEAQKLPILEIDLAIALKELGMTMDEFIDVCILCGCDYADSIRGIGPKKAFEMIKKYGTIEKLVDALDKSKYTVPENFDVDQCRKLFKDPEVTNMADLQAGGANELKWPKPDEEALTKFMVEEKGFNPERVAAGIKRINASRSKGSQGRLDCFFKVTTSQPNAHKRKGDAKAGGGGKKLKKAGPYAGAFNNGHRCLACLDLISALLLSCFFHAAAAAAGKKR